MKTIFIEKPEDVSAINPKAYSNMPICDIMAILSDWENTLSEEDWEKLIADFTVKYLMMYLLWVPKDMVVPLEHVNCLYWWMSAWLQATREHKKCIIWVPEDVSFLLHSFTQVRHSAIMIADIASTTAIVRDIVMMNIEKGVQNGTYMGIDLGSWSWILMTAMVMQAMRNKFKDVLVFWVENDQKSIARSDYVLQNIGIRGSLIFWDSTKSDTYSAIKELRLPASFIANETLPQQSAPFYVPWYPAEPFFQNHATIQESGLNWVTTQYFPHKVEVEMSNGEKKMRLMLWADNQFLSDKIWHLDEEVYSLFSPEKVQNTEISELKPLREIGDELREKSWDTNNSRRIIPANPSMHFRWTSPKSLDKNFQLPVS